MSARKTICQDSVVIILAHALVVPPTNAQDQLSIERISLSINSAFEQYARVIGELRLPNSNPEQLPAVVIVNSSPGFDGRGAFYADALNLAGIATLEIDMFQGKGLPASLRHNLPHVYQTLDYLSRHPRIDANRVGIMGFSWGGNVSVLASSTNSPDSTPAVSYASPRIWRFILPVRSTTRWSPINQGSGRSSSQPFTDGSRVVQCVSLRPGRTTTTIAIAKCARGSSLRFPPRYSATSL